MVFLRRIRLLLLVAAALFPALASALNQTYEGALEPGNRAPKIPLVVVLKDLGVALEGTVKTSAPFKASAPIDSGTNVYGECTVNVDLTKNVALRLYGRCDLESFSGSYTLWDKQKGAVTRGNFNLARKAPEPVKLDSRRTFTPSSCLKANTQCLIACPRDDETAAFMCSNRCRTKLQTCKAQTKKTAPLPDADD
jgi:hypothetical protein